MSELARKKCEPCSGGVPPLGAEHIERFLKEVPGWGIQKGYHLTREISFPDFATALSFVNRVGEIAEDQGHHPDIHLAWGKVRIEIWTHKVDGLTESDFILAAKIDEIAD